MEIVNYTFKEICNKTGYTASAIRYYEKEFKLNIPRDANGRRLFSKTEFDKLLFIKELHEQGCTNSQIKIILNENKNEDNTAAEEVAATLDIAASDKLITYDKNLNGESIIQFIDKRFIEINNNLSELNEHITGKERDLLISENMKLKMEIKRKSYEIIELKENLRFFKSKNNSFFKRLFGRKSYK